MKKIREGYKRTEVGVIPIDWDIDKLSNLVEKITDGTHKTPTYTDDGVPFLRVTDIQKSKIDWNNVKYISEEEHRELIKRCNPEIGDVLYSKNGTIGIPKIIDWNKEFSIFVSLCLIKMKKENNRLSNKYLEKYLASDSCMNQIRLRAKQGTVTNLHLEEIRELIIPMPSIEEQDSISLVLSSVDEQIEITDNLIEKTKELKKGLMQKLLTKGIGHSKFKDTEIGKIPEEWEVRSLEEVCEFWDGRRKPIKAGDRESMKGNIPYYGASGIIDWVNDYIFDDEIILLGEDGENIKSRNVPLAFKVTGKCWVNNHAHVLKVKDVNNSDFITYVLENKDYSSYVIGSAQPKLNQAQCRKFMVQVPNPDEQKQISLILSSVDEQIEQIESKKEKLQELKKGLMQNLLTGKIRVQ